MDEALRLKAEHLLDEAKKPFVREHMYALALSKEDFVLPRESKAEAETFVPKQYAALAKIWEEIASLSE
jgi:hypothetical protein